MPRTDWGWLATPEEIASWVLFEDSDLIALDKPAHLVCHPSKKGPWSSLIGACREYLGAERLHPVSRLDRETGGVIVIAKTQRMASLLQTAIQQRGAVKKYFAILEGILDQPVSVDQPIGRDPHSEFVARQAVVPDGQACLTEFAPVKHGADCTLVIVKPLTGRRHQIRVHAAHIGRPIVGDKLYGPDQQLMQRFILEGCTPDMLRVLKLDRHALHAQSISFPEALPGREFASPLPDDLKAYFLGRQGEY